MGMYVILVMHSIFCVGCVLDGNNDEIWNSFICIYLIYPNNTLLLDISTTDWFDFGNETLIRIINWPWTWYRALPSFPTFIGIHFTKIQYSFISISTIHWHMHVIRFVFDKCLLPKIEAFNKCNKKDNNTVGSLRMMYDFKFLIKKFSKKVCFPRGEREREKRTTTE